jgi:NADH-quinone oxidoreductase subunit H
MFKIFIYMLENFCIFTDLLKFKILYIIINIVKILTIILPLLISVAFFTLLERKILATVQKRVGPNFVGIFGLLQPIADGVKLLIKETVIPGLANKFIFIFSPISTFLLALIFWVVIPFDTNSIFADINVGILYIFAVSSLGVYGIIMSGWSSNSRYAFLGSLRSAAQMVSYEVSIGLILITVLVLVGSLNLIDIVEFQRHIWLIVPLWPLGILFFISALAETNRPPFDLPEAEAELVSGYNVEYSAVGFALFFIGEYANIILMSTLMSLLFFGGWQMPFMGSWFEEYFSEYLRLVLLFKIIFFMILFVLVRASFPRYRYDQLMRLGWKVYLPLSLGFVVFVPIILLIFL